MVERELKHRNKISSLIPKTFFSHRITLPNLFLSLSFSLPPKSSPPSSHHLPHFATYSNTQTKVLLCSPMVDTVSYIKPQRLASQFPPNPANPNKFYTHFMYKAVIVAIFLIVIPLLPSQAPEFVNQSLHTRSWELVQLLLVGIAVSYGLFSRRNDENQKESNSKLDNAHSYVSRFLQVSSVFDDEGDSPSGSDESKVQTWSSQYYRGEPVVVVDDDKPLVFPVQSLKSGVSDSDDAETISESSGKGISRSRSTLGSGSKRFSSKSRNNGEFWGSTPLDLEEEEEKGEENVVLRSPIPWRSRSGRMEVKEEIDSIPLYSLPPSMEESELTRREPGSFRSQTARSSRPSSSPPPFRAFPKKPSPSSSAESQAKIAEEMARKKIYYQSSSPPAPPPPPPLYVRRPPLTKSNSTPSNAETSSRKELNRSNSVTESRSRVPNDGSVIGKSARTIRARESVGWNAGEREERRQIEEKKLVVVETDEESKSESESFEGGSEVEEVASNGADN
ncbi:hypothetical protein U1Q18_019308 [Sarracenia purpurea var. burkii]